MCKYLKAGPILLCKPYSYMNLMQEKCFFFFQINQDFSVPTTVEDRTKEKMRGHYILNMSVELNQNFNVTFVSKSLHVKIH